MSWGNKRVCFNVVVRVPKSIRSVNNESREEKYKKKETKKVLNVEVRIKGNTIINRSKTEWIIRTILVQKNKVKESSSCNKKWEEVV